MAEQVTSELIATAKLANRMTTNAYDAEVKRLLEVAILDLGIAGVEVPETVDALAKQAMITYFLLHFGSPDNYAELKASYDEQKAQLSMATGHTIWGDGNV